MLLKSIADYPDLDRAHQDIDGFLRKALEFTATIRTRPASKAELCRWLLCVENAKAAIIAHDPVIEEIISHRKRHFEESIVTIGKYAGSCVALLALNKLIGPHHAKLSKWFRYLGTEQGGDHYEYQDADRERRLVWIGRYDGDSDIFHERLSVDRTTHTLRRVDVEALSRDLARVPNVDVMRAELTGEFVEVANARKMADEPGAWESATVVNEWFSDICDNYKAFGRFLTKYHVRTHKPSPNRLQVHVDDARKAYHDERNERARLDSAIEQVVIRNAKKA